MSMKRNLKRIAQVGIAAGAISYSGLVSAADTIKVGVLHSLSGTMAISESTLKDTVLMMIEQQNEKGGVMGKKLEPVVVDPKLNPQMFCWPSRSIGRNLMNTKRLSL